MLDLPDVVEAHAVRELDLLQRVGAAACSALAGPRARHLVLVEDPEAHDGPDAGQQSYPGLNGALLHSVRVRRIAIIGSTGSIGTQALDVIERSDQLEVVGLAAGSSWEPLLEQAAAHGVERIALADEDAAARASEAWTGGEVLAGAEGLVELITAGDCDLVLNALVGSAGLGPTVATLGEGIDLALANKESLVVGGELVSALAEATGARDHPGRLRALGAPPADLAPSGPAPSTGWCSPPRAARSAGARAELEGVTPASRRSPTPPGTWAARSRSTAPR